MATAHVDRNLDFAVEGMTCGSCSARVERTLAKQPGVTGAEVNFATGRAHVRATAEADVAALEAAVARTGYALRPLAAPGSSAAAGEDPRDAERAHQRMWLARLLAVIPAALFMVATMVAGDSAMTDPTLRWVAFAMATPVHDVLPIAGRYVLTSAWYQGGTSVVDFTDPANPTELTYYDGPGVYWSSYWYNGRIYGSDIIGGLDIFKVIDPALRRTARLDTLNPQTQEHLLGD